ncbi:chemotaxis methyl-accepting protein methylase [Bradyrhizobium sp. USDA 4472]
MDEVGKAPGDGERQVKAPLIIGVGASAGAIDSIERFFGKLTLGDDQAIVLVLQNREALSDQRLHAVIQRAEGAQLSNITDGMTLEGGTIYLSPMAMITTIHGGRLAVRKAEQGPGERATIDSFLVSLAEERAEQSIGVLLSGTDGDGTLGAATLKDHGGLAIAEKGADEDFKHLADSSNPAAIADYVLSPEDIPEHIQVYARHLRRLEEKQGFDEVLAAAASSLSRIADILRNKTGNDFHGYKQNTFLRRVQRRMQVVQIDEITSYVDFLRNDKDEAQNLFNDLLIGVTEFFRDKREFEVLETQIIPKIFENKGIGQQVRVWVLGCATGEEAYSIGILLREHMATLDSAPQVQIFATDIDGRALATARVGRYRTNIEQDMTPERLARWFVREGDTYCVVKELREMCIFSQHNVIKDAPFSKLDLVSCRNLLIYLNAELQNRVIPLFHFALLPDRYLFLGNSEKRDATSEAVRAGRSSRPHLQEARDRYAAAARVSDFDRGGSRSGRGAADPLLRSRRRAGAPCAADRRALCAGLCDHGRQFPDPALFRPHGALYRADGGRRLARSASTRASRPPAGIADDAEPRRRDQRTRSCRADPAWRQRP